LRQGGRPRILMCGITKLNKEPVVTESSDSGETQAAPNRRAAPSVPASLSVWERIKRHKVAQWTLAYAAAAYTVLHGTEMVSNAFEWPHLLLRIVTVLLFLGLPLVATLAWYQGHRAQQRVSGPELTIITVLLVIAGSALWHFARPTQEHAAPKVSTTAQTTAAAVRPATATPAERSIAVMPFLDLSEKKDQEYFADGMAEEIISRLSQVPDLYVPARMSSFSFKGKPTKIVDIAHELHVTHMLEGSVRKSGDQFRVTAQLIRADDGYHVWSQTYDRDFRDVFKVQDEVANAVVQALQISLMGGPLTRPKGGTQNLAAYELYLRAASANFELSKESLEAAGGYLDQAIKLDPNFGLAWAELANNAILKTNTGLLPPKEGAERARQVAQHAVQLSPYLADARAQLAYTYRTYDWDWAACEAELRRALTLEPTNSYALESAGLLSATLGRWADAERHYRLALVRDPLNSFLIANLGTTLYGAGRFVDAEATYRKLIKVAPDFLWTPYYLGKTLLAEDKREAALAIVQQDKDEEDRLILLPIVLQAAGHKAEADEALKELITRFADADAYHVAMTYAYRGDHDLAFQWLDRAYHQKDRNLAQILGEPLFKNIANDPRYKAFLRKMKLPA
jgi:TolB-like protein/Tfp pilus assembly protein PilF